MALYFKQARDETYKLIGRRLAIEERLWDLESVLYSGNTEELKVALDEIESEGMEPPIGVQQSMFAFRARIAIVEGKRKKALSILEDALEALPDRPIFGSERGFNYGIWHAMFRLAKSGEMDNVRALLERFGKQKPRIEPVLTWMIGYLDSGRSRWDSGTTPHRPFMDLDENEPKRYTDQARTRQIWRALYEGLRGDCRRNDQGCLPSPNIGKLADHGKR